MLGCSLISLSQEKYSNAIDVNQSKRLLTKSKLKLCRWIKIRLIGSKLFFCEVIIYFFTPLQVQPMCIAPSSPHRELPMTVVPPVAAGPALLLREELAYGPQLCLPKHKHYSAFP